jgi:DMSO/TMAO reductase YedYZ molybdopterin-dependent catalytic subunit/glyoxylase-like metal-dependent hydrolase (beta-lactamase superfamily II)
MARRLAMMILTQHYLGCLSHASYLIGDETTGRAVVVDPRRDVGDYLAQAAELGLTIERVIETHVHADFLSGHLELAARTGAVISYGEGAHVDFPVDELRDGERLSLGDVTLEIVATPGHTPESVCVIVYEHADDAVPCAVLTGDTLFVGDVGRPDLLATGSPELTADVLGRQLYHSLHDKLLPRLSDSTLVYPAHGAGSSCGRNLSTETSSTIGEQRRFNYALRPMDEDRFVELVTEAQPPRPHYFEFDAQLNRQLRPLLDGEAPPLLTIGEVIALRDAGAILLDPREPSDFAAGHVKGAVNVGLGGRFAEWAASVLDPDADIVLVGDPTTALEAKVRLARVGYDRVVGQLDDLGSVLRDETRDVEASARLTIQQLAELRGLDGGLQLVDVRAPSETGEGTLRGAREIPLPLLTDFIADLDPMNPVVLYCESGYRSSIAASVVRAAGFADVSDLKGGFHAWDAAGLPVATGAGDGVAGSTPHVSPRAAQALLDKGALLLDVREPDEWGTGHAPPATLIPMGQVLAKTNDLPRNRTIVVVCRSGGRSAAVTDALRAGGFEAVNLAGGMSAWSAAGLPVVTAEDAGLVVHRAEPLNCETSIPALIGGVVMPNARFYVRNHFPTPTLNAETWRLDVGGLVERPLQLSLRDLQTMPSQTLVATLECAGNGRSVLEPKVDGEQWRLGAASTAEWTGVPLVEVIERAGPRPDAVAIVMRGADSGTIEGSDPLHFERGLSLDEVRGSDALLAYAMNGDPLPLQHGYPLRVIVPGWYAVTSVKWLTAIELTATPFEGFFQKQRYVYEWEQPDGTTTFEPVRLQQVRSIITEPASDATVPRGDVVIRGVAWSGAASIAGVEVSIADGPWQPARMVGDRRRHAWQWWELITRFETAGATSLRARATDLAGRVQPEKPRWNRLGYGSNAIQTVTIHVG